MIEINNTRYYSIDEFPQYVRVDKKTLNKKGKEQLINFLRQKKRGFFYSEGIISAVIVENLKSEFSQISKQNLIQGMISIYPRFLTSKNHPYLEIFIVDGKINSRFANHKTRILIDNEWMFYKTLNLRNYELFGCHMTMLKENILPRVNLGRVSDLPEVDLYFSKQEIEETCKALRLDVDLDQHLFNEAVISESSKEIMQNKGVIPVRKKTSTELTNFNSMDKCYFLQFQKFLKEAKPNYNKNYINSGTAIIHLIDQNQNRLSKEGYMFSLKENSLFIGNAILDEKIHIFHAITNNPISVKNAKKTYEEITVTKPEGFQALLFMNLNIIELISFLENNGINDERLSFFKNLTKGIFPKPINKFRQNNIELLNDPSSLYYRLETHTKILVDCVKYYFEKTDSISEYPQFKIIYNALKNKEITHINIKSVGLSEIIFDDNDEKSRDQLLKVYSKLIGKLKNKLPLME